ncbi:MAG: hypothetical protein QOD53_474 [Thermoleophilaceae bacterium]|jgi:hypothetical protein|nr:hypothetical protein [Thermoleophilaceae bacterium]
MSTHALDTTTQQPVALRVLGHLDLIVLVLALPIFLAAGFPMAGWAAGSGIYVGQWIVREWTTRRAERASDPRTVVGLLAGSMVGRGFAVSLAILLTGLANNDAGLAAALLFLASFSIAFTIGLAIRQPGRRTP